MTPRASAPVTIGCCGLFHFRNYAPILAERGLLAQFIFSHKRRTFRSESWARNLWLKEYLLQIASRITREPIQRRIFPWLHDLWDIAAARAYRPTPVLHVMLHGTSRRLISEAKASGAMILGEAVNTHPDNYHKVNVASHRACGVPYSDRLPLQLQRLKLEIGMVDHLLVPSPYVRETFIDRGFQKEKIDVLPFGANTRVFQSPHDWSHRMSGPPKFVTVAQAIPRKGIHHLFNAWSMSGIAADGGTLSILGIVPPSMRRFVERAPAGVVFRGPLPRDRVSEELRCALVFILPTLEEGFAVAVLEAMAAGCSVVTTTASGAEGVIHNRLNGILLEPGDSHGMADAIVELARNRELAVRIGRAAMTTARDHYSWNRYVMSLENIYAGLL